MNTNVQWNADYDVVVVGFGGAGGSAARFAADNGAKVLLLDAAPYGHEGGNTRYCAQHIAMGHDFNKLKDYYKALAAPFTISEAVLDAYVKGLTQIPEYLTKYLGVDHPYIASCDKAPGKPLYERPTLAEYPELPGSDTFDFALVHDHNFDAALWKLIRENVKKRSNNIDVWLASRAVKLIQDPASSRIDGVVINRDGKEYTVHARRGVVLSLGGFENNAEMQQNFLLQPKRTPLGTLYNRGDGIKMAEEVGAKLWHMNTWENHGIMPGYTFYEGENKRGRQIKWNLLTHGSIFVVSDDATRFFNEDEAGRHGHSYSHGAWEVPTAFENAYLVFDQKQFDKFDREAEQGALKYPSFMDKLVKGESLTDLAQKTNLPAANLQETIDRFNFYIDQKKDFEFNRPVESMEKFDGNGKVYAIKLAPSMLNTQGGPQRNEHGQILDVNEKPIEHLFGAGELGGVCVNHYQGGGNVAECLIFGKIAGESAAKAEATASVELTNPVGVINDLISGDAKEDFAVEDNQYLGESEAGLGGKIVVRVTYEDKTIKNVEVVEDHETEGIGEVAVKEIPGRIVQANSVDVDAVSGASATSRALKEAVKSAIAKAEK